MKRKFYIFTFLLTLATSAVSQTLNRAEYFFDDDPGTGSSTALTLTPGATIDANFAININALSTGFHNLNIRLRDNTGKWSHFQSRTFYLAPLSSLTPPSVNVTKAEYFFDNDPGFRNGTNVPITPTASLNQNIVIPISSLTPGFHSLNFRVFDDQKKWSHFVTRTFYIVPPLPGSSSLTLTKAEYFFNDDPGTGLATSIAITPGGQINQNIVVPLSALPLGFHTLNFRVRDDQGKWSHFTSRTFYIIPPLSTPLSTTLKKAEYFFDNDPGSGNATPLPITSGNPQDNNFAIDISSLSAGFHRLSLRYQDNQNHWSHFAARTFYIVPLNTLGATNLERLEYFIDTDPDVNPSIAGNALPFTPASTVDQTFVIDLSGTPQGNHKLYVRAKDDTGLWSTRVSADFTILACTPPTAPVAPTVSRCGQGPLTLSATGATGSQVYQWYDDVTTSTILFTGNPFDTPSLTATRDYFVSIFDPVTLCESNRVSVAATIISTAPPLLNITSATICEGSSIKISAPTGFTTYLWSNGETTREIIVGSGSYSVAGGDGTCESQPSAPALIIVSPQPAKPSITASGTTSLCDGTSVTLSAPAGFTYLWSNGQTTQDILVNASGSYSVMVMNGSGCSSNPSDAIVVTANTTPTKPTINVFGSTALCGTNTVGLLAPSGFSVYQWSGGQTTQGFNAATAGPFSVIVGNAANCLSVASDPVMVTATGLPCTTTGGTNSPPTITAQTLSVQIEGRLQKDLAPFINDPDNNLDFASLRVINNETSKGVAALIDGAYNLIVDYNGNPFTGDDRVTIEVCDLTSICAQQIFDIEVAGGVEVFNGVTPDGDGLNDFFFIKYLDVVEGASKNKVTIINRWGDVVFEIDDYDNLSRIFSGQTNSGKDLPSGTYFYKVDFSQGNPISGFITLKR